MKENSVRLGAICTFQSGGTPSKGKAEYYNGSIPWVTTVALNGGYIDQSSAVEWITDEAIRNSAAKIVPANSLMVGTRVGIGKAAINTVSMATSQDIISLLDIDDEVWSKEYLLWFIRGKSAYLQSQSRGATIKGIKIETLAALNVLKMPIGKQIELAGILKMVENLIVQRKQQLAGLDALIKARFIEMFGDVENNPFAWRKEPLKSHIDMLTGYPFDSSGYVESGIKICGGLIILPDKIKWDECKYWLEQEGYEKFLLAENDIVVALDRPWITDGFKIGMISAEDLPALLIQRTARIRAKDMAQAFVLYLLKDSSFERHCTVTGSLVPHISNRDINNYQVIVPPLELQNQFAAFVAQVDKAKAAVQKALDEAQTLFDSLMQEYFG